MLDIGRIVLGLSAFGEEQTGAPAVEEREPDRTVGAARTQQQRIAKAFLCKAAHPGPTLEKGMPGYGKFEGAPLAFQRAEIRRHLDRDLDGAAACGQISKVGRAQVSSPLRCRRKITGRE